MKKSLLSLFIILWIGANAQHCPWDCTGFLMIKTNASEAEMKKLKPVLVDGRKKPVVDTLYGTGLPTYDLCTFLLYRDFKKYRTERIKLHWVYQYDTLLSFAEGHYVVHYNFCHYQYGQDSALFIRFTDPQNSSLFRYIEVPRENRIHLHELNSAIRIQKRTDVLKDVLPMVMIINRKEWKIE